MGQYLTLNVYNGNEFREIFDSGGIRPKYVKELFELIGLTMDSDDSVVTVDGDIPKALELCRTHVNELLKAELNVDEMLWDNQDNAVDEMERKRRLAEDVLNLLKIATVAIKLGGEAVLFFA